MIRYLHFAHFTETHHGFQVAKGLIYLIIVLISCSRPVVLPFVPLVLLSFFGFLLAACQHFGVHLLLLLEGHLSFFSEKKVNLQCVDEENNS